MKSAGRINSVYCCQFALLHAFLIYLFGVQPVQHHSLLTCEGERRNPMLYLLAHGSHICSIE